MRLLRTIIIVSTLCLTILGCAPQTSAMYLPRKRPISYLPTPSDFKKTIAQLKQEYPDLRYDFMPMYVWQMPKAEPLKSAWGEPHDTGFSNLILCLPIWVLTPTYHWYWGFEDKKVSATITYHPLFGFDPYLSDLEIEKVNELK